MANKAPLGLGTLNSNHEKIQINVFYMIRGKSVLFLSVNP